ncbi:MAG: YkgJ family cysteine cluster protein [Kofleriaceae bacterium]
MRAVLAGEVVALAQAISACWPATDEQQDELATLGTRFELLVSLLQWGGVLEPHHLQSMQQLRPAVSRRRVRLSVVEDKRAVGSPDIDCASLASLCKVRCCRAFDIELSREDLDDGLRWDVESPYLLARAEHGCTYLSAQGCTVYERRPATCRSYDCRSDPRVWTDFAQRIPAP